MTQTEAIHVGRYGDYTVRQMVGRHRDPGTGHITRTPQNVDEVLRNSVRIGYCGRHTGAPFTPIAALAPEELTDAVKAITVIRLGEGLFGPPGRVSHFPDQATDELIADVLSAKQKSEGEDEDEDTEDHDDGDFDAELGLAE